MLGDLYHWEHFENGKCLGVYSKKQSFYKKRLLNKK